MKYIKLFNAETQSSEKNVTPFVGVNAYANKT